MSYRARSRIYRQLKEELQQEEYQALLLRLQEREGFPRKFRTWADVIAFMVPCPTLGRDKVLRPILRVHREDGNPHWRTILLVIFWPALMSIARRKRHWEEDDEERWQTIVSTFLRTIGRVDVAQRHRRYSQKLLNDTVHYVHDQFHLLWAQRHREISVNLDEITAAENPDGVLLEERDKRETEVRRLKGYMERGHISPADFRLLMETRVHGMPLTDYARKIRQKYQTAKKRRQRVEALLPCRLWRES